MEITLHCIPPHEVRRMWLGPVHDMIDAGFAAFDVPMPTDILEQLRYGTRLLWVAVDDSATIVAAALTQLFPMRSGLVCKVLECGGDHMREWIGLRDQIEQYARDEGCARVLIEGRPGWARMLPDYAMIGVTLEKRV